MIIIIILLKFKLKMVFRRRRMNRRRRSVRRSNFRRRRSFRRVGGVRRNSIGSKYDAGYMAKCTYSVDITTSAV